MLKSYVLNKKMILPIILFTNCHITNLKDVSQFWLCNSKTINELQLEGIIMTIQFVTNKTQIKQLKHLSKFKNVL